MGVYVNPKGGDKEGWLREHATEISREETMSWDGYGGEEILLCAVSDWHGVAIAVGYRKEEIQYWTENAKDLRPKRFYKAPVSEVLKVSTLESYSKPGSLSSWAGAFEEKELLKGGM